MLVGVDHEELIILHIGCRPRYSVPVVGCLSSQAVLPDNFLLLEVDEDNGLPVADLYEGFVGVGESGVHQMAHVFLVVAPCPQVDLVERKQFGLLAGQRINGVALFHVCLYQPIAPPGQKHVLGLHVGVVRPSEIQVFEGEKLVLGGHGRWDCDCC